MLLNKLSKIKLLLLDVDGVLTDGSIICDDNGNEIKKFNVKDGLGIKLLMTAGIKVGIVSGRKSKALNHRCKELGIDLVFSGIKNKALILDDIIDQCNVKAEEIAFIGDDLIDLPIFKKIGCPIAVSDAHETVKEAADIITYKKGGDGAVREICEAILKYQNLWDKVMEHFK